MARITLQGSPVTTVGELPRVGAAAPACTLTKTDLSDVTLASFAGKTVILNIFPSVDTPTCATSVRQFHARAGKGAGNRVVVCVSMDLPFALARFCGAEGLDHVVPTSCFRSTFGKDYGLTIVDGPLKGLLARAVIVVDAKGIVRHTELVAEIAHEPNYQQALAIG